MASDPVALAQELIRIESVTPDRGMALELVRSRLEAIGFDVEWLCFGEPGTDEVPNLYARLGTKAPNLCFAGHTDVVPVGDQHRWQRAPFCGDVVDGVLHGRGAADMKAAIAAAVVAAEKVVAHHGNALPGSLSFLLTGDEEGPGLHGTKRVLDHLKARGEVIDLCVVGEPTNPETFGEMIKIGRRGSLHGVLRVDGIAGHVAYPHRAQNPIPGLLQILVALTAEPLDEGNAHFQPSNLEVLDLRVGNDADNVIPGAATARFNVRFNSEYTPERLMAELRRRCDRPGVPYTLDFRLSGDSFLTPPGVLSATLVEAIRARTGLTPTLSTTGGTSDARFLKDHCAVVEFGLVGATMHKQDECVAVADVLALTDIYEALFLRVLEGAKAERHASAD